MNTIKLSDLNIYDIGNSIGIAGVIYADASNAYLCPLVGVDLPEMSILKMDVEEWTTFLRQTDIQEVEVMTPEGKAILRKSNRMIDANVSWKVFRRAGYKCEYCGTEDAPLTVDHLVLWENGGPSTEDNLASSCRRCNKQRANKSYAEWMESEYYQRVCTGLSLQKRVENTSRLQTLHLIKRVKHVRSR